MGYGITTAGDLEEDIRLLIDGRCACGNPLVNEATLYEPAGKVSLTALLDLATQATDLARCLCGAWNGREGHSRACYALPGGPWLLAEVSLDRQNFRLAVSDRLPVAGARVTTIIELSGAEIEAARRIGQPASVRVAWLEALFATELGETAVAFPCGAGVRCLVTTDTANEGQLDLSVLRLPGGPEEWLPEPQMERIDSRQVVCIVQADHEAVSEQLLHEVKRHGLRVVSRGRHQLTMCQADGMFDSQLNVSALLANAVGRGLLPRLEAGFMVQRALSELRALDAAGRDLVSRLSPLNVRAVRSADGPQIELTLATGPATVDIATYAQAPEPVRQHIASQIGRA